MAERTSILRTVGAIGAVAVALGVFIAWSIVAHQAARSGRSDAGGPEGGGSKGRPESVTGSGTHAPSAEATVVPGAPVGGDGAAGGGSRPPVKRAARVAYRRQGWVCVAEEGGGGEQRVIASESGVFALAPDGRTLAVVDTSGRMLVLADVESGQVVTVGAAEPDRPSWSPDSSWLVYTAPGAHIRRVGRDGTGQTALFDGSLPSVAIDGSCVVGAGAAGAHEVIVWRAGALSRIGTPAPVAGVAASGSRVYYGTAPAGTGSASLTAVGTDGRGAVLLAASPASGRMIAVCELRLSPDSSRIAYAECGDDGFSRTFGVPVAGGAPVAFSTRRDTYPVEWSADGQRLLFIEGNAFQGEPTSLVSAGADGRERVRLVDGAGR